MIIASPLKRGEGTHFDDVTVFQVGIRHQLIDSGFDRGCGFPFRHGAEAMRVDGEGRAA
jgi:hypothetical protein